MLLKWEQKSYGRFKSNLSIKVPKISLMAFWMFSVHSQLHWSFINKHKMFSATSATAVSESKIKIRKKNQIKYIHSDTFESCTWKQMQNVGLCCSQVTRHCSTKVERHAVPAPWVFPEDFLSAAMDSLRLACSLLWGSHKSLSCSRTKLSNLDTDMQFST